MGRMGSLLCVQQNLWRRKEGGLDDLWDSADDDHDEMGDDGNDGPLLCDGDDHYNCLRDHHHHCRS